MNAIHRCTHRTVRRGFALALTLAATQAALAAPPVVSTVPVDPNDPLQPHDIISGKITTLKGAVDIASVGATWTWNPGDGTASVSGTVMPTATSAAQTDDVNFTPYYAIWIPHTYTGDDGDVFFATLTVTNTAGEPDSEIYRMELRDVTLPVEVNVAIDESLWYMHRSMFRFNGVAVQNNAAAVGAVPMGRWDFQQVDGAGEPSAVASAVNAFEANGYVENGPASSPYTETVTRGLRYVIAHISSAAIVPQTFNRPAGAPDSPDSNGNGAGLLVNSNTRPLYEGGMVMDAIIASGTPNAVAMTGAANVIGRTYRDIVQDMVDYYAYAQSDSASHGGWQYTAFNNSGGAHDNSASGWGAIGLIAAEDVFGISVPEWLKARNITGLEFTDNESTTTDVDGKHGYTSTGEAWGAFSVTAAAMVQMAMDDIAATTSLTPDERWIRSENFMRRHFNDVATGNNFKNYYYAMFNFAKAMRSAVPEEVVLIGTNVSVGCGMDPVGTAVCGGPAAPLDWYLDQTQGLARVIVDYQVETGTLIGMFTDRPSNSHGASHDEYNTAWATQILTRTLFQAGPVSRARGTPNPGAANSPIALDGSDSSHQDAARSLVSYQWDFDNNGTFDATGVMVAHSFACPTLPVPCSYQVRLRVTDDNVPARFDDDIVVIEITIPPRPPTADAGGPYLVCMNEEFELDGSSSSDVDEGTSESGSPPFDTITSYGWELDSVSPFDFDEATGINPTTSFAALGVRNVGLRVRDNTALAFPTAAQPNLADSGFGTVDVVDCGCMGPVSARTKPGKVQLTWSPVPGAASYDILRSTVGPTRGLQPIRAGHVTDYATYLDANLTNGQTYYYRVRAMGADGLPLCGASLPVAGTPQADRRARPDTVVVPDVSGQSESAAGDTLVTALLAIGDISRVTDAGVPAGDVIRTVPAAGSRVVEGSAIALVVSSGPTLIVVPDVIGDVSADAQATIVAAGLIVGTITQANDNAIPAGNVISQDPIGGLSVVLGGQVDLVISLGPQLFALPDVVGQTQAAATIAITGAGFALGTVNSVNDAAVPAGQVISQNPAAGGAHVLGTVVDLVVSLGPVTVAVPNVIGQTQAGAESAIVAAGLAVGAIGQQNSNVVPAGIVMTQSPGAGSQVLPGSLVDFVVSLGANQVTVPNVVGLTQGAAEAAIAGAALGVGAITQQNSVTVALGLVISQNPAGGTTADESSLVAIVVSLGPAQVTVPNVVGQTQAAATAALVGADLVLGTVSTATDPLVPAGLVLSQNPGAGTVVNEDSAVAIVVSLGAAPVLVPNVVGQTQANAAVAIVGADLVVGTVTNATSGTVPAGSVISQSPVGGTTVGEGSAVDLVVSLGPAQVSVPNVVGQTQAAATAAIVGADLVLGTVGTATDPLVPAGIVLSQNPGAGAVVNEDSAVAIVVSLGVAQVQVPNVVGQTEAAASAAIVGANLVLGTVGSSTHPTIAAGSVISQSPLGGTTVNEGSAVDLVVSLGPAQVTVPNVVGQTQGDATTAIVGADLVLGTIGTATDPLVPAGIVLSQNPAAGTTVNEESAVDIVVSVGLAPTTVPNVVGQTQANAAAAIVAANLVVGAVTNATSPTVPAGNVISQSPAGGTTVGGGSAVDVVVSLGPAQISVPNVVGQTQANGTSAITAVGLVVGTVTELNSDTTPAGAIISQAPASGTVVNEGSAVNLFVSLGPAPVAVPNVVGQSEAGAGATLLAAGLTVGTLTQQPSAVVAAGDIISQNPGAGTFVSAGTAVNLVVSTGAPADAVPPSVAGVFNASPPNYAPGTPALLGIVASDNSGTVTVTGTLDGGTLPIARPTTTIATAALAIGAHTVVLTATDPGGLTDTDVLTFYVINTADTTNPTASITAPAIDAVLQTQVNVTGTANDANLVKYELQLAPVGTGDFLTFHTGTTTVVSGTLGQLDPTLFASGIYDLRLLVQDAGGRRTAAQRPVRIDTGSNAPGAFRLEFVDLDVPVAGLPITVKRIYDSRDRGRKGDYGFGWHLEVIRSGRYVNNRPPGDGWIINEGGLFGGLPCQGSVNETKVHVTEVRFSETEFYRFKLNLVKDGTLGITGACLGTVNFSQIGGVPGASLAILGSAEVAALTGTDQLVDFDLDTFDFGVLYEPAGVRLTTIDNRQFEFSRNGGLTQIRDANGNMLTFSGNSISHSAGTSVNFVRDGQGRITSMTGPNGVSRSYAYDLRGDLVTANDFMANATTFGYDAGHLIENIVDPLGNMPMRYEYDAAGRVVKQYDAEGHSITIDTNTAAGTTTVTDRLGTIRSFSYDTRGNITSANDGTTSVQRTFDARGNKLTETDQLGNLRVFAYDANDNLLSERDALGHTTSYSYGAGTRITGVADALANGTSFTYDAVGNPASVTDGDGVVVQAFVNNAAGNPTQVTTLGGTVNLTYNALGRVTRRQGPGALDVTFTYDANGRQLTQTVARTVNGSPVTETTVFTYNANGQVLTKTDPLGGETSFAYNAAGHLTSTTDPIGNTTTFTLDKRGNATRKDYADGTFEAFTYDGQGRMTAALDRLGRTTFYEFDPRHNLVATIYPGGGTVVNTYDAADRLLTAADQLGRVTSYTYDAVGHVLTKTDPAGGITRFTYDALGAMTRIEDPLGRVTNMEYDYSTFGAPRLERMVFTDTSERRQTYAPSGRLASVIDENGNTTAYTYDGAGRVLTVTDALGHVTTYGYDQAGNRITETDASGRIMRFAYDANQRLISRQKPTGETETFAYDVAGNLLEHTDFKGVVISFEYDARNRLVRKNLPGSLSTVYTYTATDMLARIDDASGGVTTYAYDVLDRVTSIAYPGGDTLTYTYDAVGNRLSVAGPQGTTTYTYDALNRMASATTGGQTTTYTYDAVGNPLEVTYPNGTESQFVYNSRNRMTSASAVGTGGALLAGQTYLMDAVGNRTRMTEASGRVVSYDYDATYRLLSEADNVSGAAVTTSYTYDNVGNRLTKNVGGGVTSYTYDAADKLLTEGGFTYTYDANGNLLGRSDGVTYTYDAENHLTSHTGGGVTTTYGYDNFGNRVRTTTGAAVTNYVVDPEDASGLAQVVAEKNGAGVVTRGYVYGNDLIRETQGGVSSYYHADALGSTRALTDGGGNLTDTYAYTAFGELAGSTGSTANDYRFAGEQLDPASQLYYLRARYLDPRIGRFLTTDPFAGDVNNPMTLHDYLYAANNPANVIDPTGQFFGGLAGISISFSIATTLSSIAITGYGIYNDLKDIYDKINVMVQELPTLKLNKELTAAELRVRIIQISVGTGGVNINLDTHLGGGAVGKASEIAKDLSGKGGDALAFIYSYSMGEWLSHLPAVHDPSDNKNKPGFYLSCGFNAYLNDIYKIQLLNGGIKGAALKPMLRVLGMWLNYTNLIALVGDTAGELGSGVPPPPPPSGACPISSALP